MSQQSSPRKPSTARSTAESSRMPFAAAEALLWGKEIKRDLEFLVPQMKELQRQHEVYDARIQATEITAEAAEAATARVQRIEQKIAAIEQDDTDRPFEKWVGEEITQLKVSTDRNKDVRTKLIELENRFSTAADNLDIATDMSKDHCTLLRRLEDLEVDRRRDSNRIKVMEKEVHDLRMLCHSYATKNEDLQEVISRRGSLAKTVVRPMEVHQHEINPRHFRRASSSARTGAFQNRDTITESETEDEDLDFSTRERIQVPRSPGAIVDSSSDAVLVSSSPSKGRQAKSARLNMMRRPSIYDARMPRASEHKETRAHPLRPNSRSHVNKAFPETQLVNKINSGKRKRPLEATQSRRVLRNRIQPSTNGFQQPVFPTSNEKQRDAVADANTSVTQQGPFYVPSVQQPAKAPVQHDPNNQTQASTTKSKKSVACKATMPSKPRSNRLSGTCLECRKRKQKCDRSRPACGQCTKRGMQCAYDQSPGDNTQNVVPEQLIAPKKRAPRSSANKRQTRYNVNCEIGSRNNKSKQPASPVALHPPTAPLFASGSSAAGPSRTSKSSRFPIPTPDAPDLQTFLEMQAKGQVV